MCIKQNIQTIVSIYLKDSETKTSDDTSDRQ